VPGRGDLGAKLPRGGGECCLSSRLCPVSCFENATSCDRAGGIESRRRASRAPVADLASVVGAGRVIGVRRQRCLGSLSVEHTWRLSMSCLPLLLTLAAGLLNWGPRTPSQPIDCTPTTGDEAFASTITSDERGGMVCHGIAEWAWDAAIDASVSQQGLTPEGACMVVADGSTTTVDAHDHDCRWSTGYADSCVTGERGAI
jgi:hypothetical protein